MPFELHNLLTMLWSSNTFLYIVACTAGAVSIATVVAIFKGAPTVQQSFANRIFGLYVLIASASCIVEMFAPKDWVLQCAENSCAGAEVLLTAAILRWSRTWLLDTVLVYGCCSSATLSLATAAVRLQCGFTFGLAICLVLQVIAAIAFVASNRKSDAVGIYALTAAIAGVQLLLTSATII